MWWLFMVLIVGYIGFSAYGRGKRAGIWALVEVWNHAGLCGVRMFARHSADSSDRYEKPIFLAGVHRYLGGCPGRHRLVRYLRQALDEKDRHSRIRDARREGLICGGRESSV